MVPQDSPPNPNSSTLHQNFAVYGSFHQNQSLLSPDNARFFGERSTDHTRHFMDILGVAASSAAASNDVHQQTQKLSLSLGSFTLFPSAQETTLNQNSPMNPRFLNPRIDCFADYSPSSSSSSSALASVVSNSKFLRPAMSLLAEVASVSVQDSEISEKCRRRLSRTSKNGSLVLHSTLGIEFPTNETEAKIIKLISMLEEVERRYERYCNRMEELVSSFEVISGRSYTTLAFEAMSKHFCSLRDAITSQLNSIRRKTSSDDTHFHSAANNRIQRLSTLQQLGIIQSSRQAWRPIRGLPETSVAILRAWLFQHFLHPYPNDSEKLMLASQTGLTKNQVSNWFINARVRLWKPMIEEMYREEFAESSSADDESGHQHHHHDHMFGAARTPTEGVVTHSAED